MTGIEAKIDKGGPTVHTLLELVIDDKERADGSSSGSSWYGRRYDWTKVLRRASLIMIDESSTIERRCLNLLMVHYKICDAGDWKKTKKTQD